MNLNKTVKYTALIVFIAIIAMLIGYFKFLIICILLSIALAMIGNPLMNLLKKVHFKKIYLNNSISAGITLVVLIAFISLIFYFLFPMIFSQIMQLTHMDTSKIVQFANNYGDKLRVLLIEYGIIENKTNAFETFINQELLRLAKGINFEQLLGGIVSLTKNMVLGTFSILFLTFFFLRDRNYMKQLVLSAIPNKYSTVAKHVFASSTKLISRYFIGIVCEMLIVTLLLFIGFTLAGFPNALLIASICGVMVIIPYLGAVIGSIISFVILLASSLETGTDINILNTLFIFYGIFIGVKLLDDFIMQPLIYSKSVKAHPVEIFLVILIAGQIGGILGMIIAIPAYTLLRIIAKECYSKSKFVKNLVKDI